MHRTPIYWIHVLQSLQEQISGSHPVIFFLKEGKKALFLISTDVIFQNLGSGYKSHASDHTRSLTSSDLNWDKSLIY